MTRVAIVGIHEYPSRLTDGTVDALRIKAHSAARALDDAGLSWRDVDALYDTGDGLAWPGLYMPEYFDLDLRILDTTAVGGSAYEFQVGRALADLGTGRANVALLTYGATTRSAKRKVGLDSASVRAEPDNPMTDMEDCWGSTLVADYAMVAARYLHDHGITAEDLAEIAVTARYHAMRNPAAVRAIDELKLRPGPGEITVDDVLSSPLVADPLRVLDCCMVSDGGGAVLLATEAVARGCRSRPVWVLGAGQTSRFRRNGDDLTLTGAARSGPAAFEQAGITPEDVDIAMIYDSFTITALSALEDLGFCGKGEAGDYIKGGRLRYDQPGAPALNTDGGGLSSNHPGQRGIFLLIEAVRQLRGESTAQVTDASIAVAHGTGGTLGRRHASGTVVLGKEAA